MYRAIVSRTSGRIAVGIIVLLLLMAIFGKLVAPYNPLESTTAGLLKPPSWSHPFGTDYLARDVLSRLLAGSFVSLLGAVMVAGIGLVVGGLTGVLSVVSGRAFEWVTLRVADTLMSIPFLILAISITALLGNGELEALVAVGILISPGFYRVTRAATLAAVSTEFVQAATLSGASVAWVLRKHVWAKIMPQVFVALANIIGLGVVVIATLSFLGIGQQAPAPSWGGILAEDLNYLGLQPYGPLFPVALIVAAVWSLHTVADLARSSRSTITAARAELAGADEASAEVAELGISASAEVEAPVDGHSPPPVIPPVIPLVQPAVSVGRLSVKDASGRLLVDDVSFDLRPGETLGIVGESGSGKTLTCSAILGILPGGLTRSGRVELGGRSTDDFGAHDWNAVRGAYISAIFQDPAAYLNPSITVGKQVAELLRVRKKLRRRAARNRALELLELVRIRGPERVYDLYPHELSGGMLQRVLIAMAVSLDPEVIIADEATTALDVTVQSDVIDVLASLRESRSLALLFVTHDLALVSSVCDRVLVMRHGQIVETGSAQDVTGSPQHPYTQLLISQHGEYGLERFIDTDREEVAWATN